MNKIYITVLVATIMAVVSCTGPKHPGLEYMPDMAHSRAFETYVGSEIYADSMSARLPVEGTIARGFMPYEFPNTEEGYEMAGSELVNPIAKTDANIKEGKRLYGIYCAVCHGEKGEGNGTIVESGAYPPPPAYSVRLKGMPQGKMYHSIHYGKNLMGGYASQLSSEERWKVVHYIQQFAPVEETTEVVNENE